MFSMFLASAMHTKFVYDKAESYISILKSSEWNWTYLVHSPEKSERNFASISTLKKTIKILKKWFTVLILKVVHHIFRISITLLFLPKS